MGPKKKKEAVLIEGLDTTEMTFQKLQQYTHKLYERLQKEREERNYFQMERDKLRTFWELATHNLDEARAKLVNQDHDLELADDRRVRELRWVNQKVKFLEYEQNLKMNEMAVKEKNSVLQAEKDFAEQENELLHDKTELKYQLKEAQDFHQQEIKNLKLELAEKATDIRKDLETQVESMEFIYEKRIYDAKLFLDTKQKVEMAELDERKNQHIKDLMDDHDLAFNEMRNYYNNIMLNNFSLIMDLKEIIENMKAKEARKNKSVKELTRENASLKEALKKDREDSHLLRQQVDILKKNVASLNTTKKTLKEKEIELERMKWDYDILNMHFENYKEERQNSEQMKLKHSTKMQKREAEKLCKLKMRQSALENEVKRKSQLLDKLMNFMNTILSRNLIKESSLNDYHELMGEMKAALQKSNALEIPSHRSSKSDLKFS
ncbi:dynein regulatory complex subunit 4 [Nilaparvata lugens]|uniref:dynein regulatory complex subunit 4 n=1 Tax=Nilaparvata lugens TaxID=108931 RepID=UPI00193E2611|nr:dynein regulatory complex subunit 4 [Nilaparvata lugens]